MSGTGELGDMAGQHSDKVEQMSDQGIERAGDMADERTGGEHGDQVDKAQDVADGRVGGEQEQEQQSPT